MKELVQLFNLKGKSSLVIGGAGYLGRAASEVLAEMGANVAIASRNVKNCEKVKNDLKLVKGQRHLALECDILKAVEISQLKNHIKIEYGSLDVLVVTAWTGKKNSWKSINEQDWKFDIDICLNSHFSILKQLESLMNENSKIILVSSMYGQVAPKPELYVGVPQANPPSYGVAKAGIIQFTKYLAAWLAEKKINVNCISPGPFPFQETIREHPEFCERLRKQNPMNELGSPEDLKGVYALLSSDAARYINGQNISVDGGWTIW